MMPAVKLLKINCMFYLNYSRGEKNACAQKNNTNCKTKCQNRCHCSENRISMFQDRNIVLI